MTSRSCRVNTWASVLLVLVVSDVILVGRSIGVRIRHQKSPVAAISHQTGDYFGEQADEDEPASLEARVLRTLGLQHVAGGRHRQRQHRTSAAERVVVPEYMWKLYRRQQRANGERQHRRPAATGGFTRPPYTANTIRSFVATSYSDSFTGE